MTLALFLVVFALVLALWAALLRYLLGKLTFGRGSGSNEPTRPSPTSGGTTSGNPTVVAVIPLSRLPKGLRIEILMPWPDPYQKVGHLVQWGRN